MGEDSGLENLRQDVRDRANTDKILSPAWVLLPFIAVAIGLIVATAALVLAFTAVASIPIEDLEGFDPLNPDFDPLNPDFDFNIPPPSVSSLPGALALITSFGLVGGLLSSLLYAYLLYILLSRRNKHFRRQSRFSEDFIAHLRSLTSKKGLDEEVGLSNLERTAREMKNTDDEKSAILWTVLAFIPIVNVFAILYILYFLGKDFRIHERNEDGFIEDSGRILQNVGLELSVRRMDPTPNRSFILYIILSIVTFGLFGIYWLYTLIADPNAHFKHHQQYEDDLISKLSSIK